MRSFILMILCFLSLTAAGAKKVYEVDLDVSRGGDTHAIRLKLDEKQLGKPQIKKDSSGGFVEVIATKESLEGENGIMLNLVVGEINSKGEAIVLSRPQVFTKLNDSARVNVTHEDGGQDLKLSVMVK